jgi:hypothetical protein
MLMFYIGSFSFQFGSGPIPVYPVLPCRGTGLEPKLIGPLPNKFV